MAADEEVAQLKARIAELEAELAQLKAEHPDGPAEGASDTEWGEFNPG